MLPKTSDAAVDAPQGRPGNPATALGASNQGLPGVVQRRAQAGVSEPLAYRCKINAGLNERHGSAEADGARWRAEMPRHLRSCFAAVRPSNANGPDPRRIRAAVNVRVTES